jgi:hypothetical protein
VSDAQPHIMSAELIERIARALCVHYSGDPDIEFGGRLMWRQFEEDARAVLPVIVALANEIRGHAGEEPSASTTGT